MGLLPKVRSEDDEVELIYPEWDPIKVREALQARTVTFVIEHVNPEILLLMGVDMPPSLPRKCLKGMNGDSHNCSDDLYVVTLHATLESIALPADSQCGPVRDLRICGAHLKRIAQSHTYPYQCECKQVMHGPSDIIMDVGTLP